jgi:hypothetical protein
VVRKKQLPQFALDIEKLRGMITTNDVPGIIEFVKKYIPEHMLGVK